MLLNVIGEFVKGRFSAILFFPTSPMLKDCLYQLVRLLRAPAKGVHSYEAGESRSLGFWELKAREPYVSVGMAVLCLNDLWTLGLSFVEVWKGWL